MLRAGRLQGASGAASLDTDRAAKGSALAADVRLVNEQLKKQGI